MANNFDCSYNDIPVCPHCGKQDSDDLFGLDLDDEAQNDMTCNSCGKDFIAVIDLTIHFNTATTKARAANWDWGLEEDPDETDDFRGEAA